jgi:hypothetical protein
MAFGLDPSIILSGMPNQLPVPTVNDTVETLGRLGQYKAQQQHQEAQLADLMRKRQQEQTIADIVRRNAGTLPAGLPRDLAAAGRGDAAMDWMKGQSEMASRKAATDKLTSGLYELGLQRLRGRLSVVKTPEEYAQIVAQIPPEELAQLGLSGQYNPVEVEGFIAGGTPSKQWLSPEQADAAKARAEYERAKAEALKRGPSRPDLAKQRNLELKNQKLEQELGGAGGTPAPETPKEKNVRLRNEKLEKELTDAAAKPNKYAERKVGGYDFDPEDPPTLEGAKKMANVLIAKDKALGALGRLEKLFDKHGKQMYGDVASQMESEWKQVTDQIRVQNEMGVPNGADYVMLAKQIPNPVGLDGAKQLKSSIKAKFEPLRKQLAETVDATARAYKYRLPRDKSGTPSGLTKDEAEEMKRLDAKYGPKAGADLEL